LPFDIPPLDLGFSLNAFNPYPTPPMSLPAQNVNVTILPDVPTRASVSPFPDVDWSFSHFICSPPLLQDTSSSGDKQLFPPEHVSFDPMMLNPTQPNGDVDATFADRTAKEKKLLEMKEATRRLEEELATS